MTDTVKLHIIDREGKKHTIDAEIGATLKDAVLKEIPMSHFGDCGGCCACATCHMYIDSGWKWAVNGIDIDENTSNSNSSKTLLILHVFCIGNHPWL